MPKVMKFVTVLSFAATIITIILFHFFNGDMYLTLAITFGTIFYHLVICLFVVLLNNVVIKNRAYYTIKCYQIHPW